MNKRDEHLLLSIKDECEYLFEKAEGRNLDDFIDDRDLKYIVVLVLIKIGEYVNSMSQELKVKNKHVDWIDIVSLRNTAVHNYDGLYMDWIWEVVTRDVPELLEQVEEILRVEGVDEGE